MGDLWDDLTARWAYHPTFRSRVIAAALAVALVAASTGLLVSYEMRSPACRADLNNALTEGHTEGEMDTLNQCAEDRRVDRHSGGGAEVP